MQIKHFANAANAADPAAVPLATDYFSAVDTAPDTEKIGAASISQDPTFPGRQYGSNANFTTTYTGGLFGTNQTTKVTGTTVNSVDPGGALKIAPYPLAAGASVWGINGGSIVSTTSTSETSTQDSLGNMLSYTNTTLDSADDLTVTMTGNVGGNAVHGNHHANVHRKTARKVRGRPQWRRYDHVCGRYHETGSKLVLGR